MSHWADYLVRGFPTGQDSTVEITVNPSRDHSGVVLIASRLRGLVDALRSRPTDEGLDPLLDEHPDDLLRLLDHLHRVRLALEAQEERVLEVAHQRGIPLRRLATALGVRSPETVRYRLERIRQAAERGLTAAALDETDREEC